MEVKEKLAEYLLKVQAVQLSPNHPFRWASGMQAPIYTDNRRLLSFPLIRNFVRDAFVEIVKSKYPSAQYIAGVATSAIPLAAIVANELNLPMVYVRPKAKDHGLQNRIEGFIPAGVNVVVIEDLISTASSSLTVVKTLRETGVNVLGLLAIFSYALEISEQNLDEAKVQLTTLTDYITLIDKALEMDYITVEELTVLKKWRKNPEQFYPSESA